MQWATLMAIKTQSNAIIKLHRNQSQKTSDLRRAEVLTQLRLLGADEYDMLLPETRCLPKLLHAGEEIFGVVYGRYKRDNDDSAGRGMLAVTNQRVLFIDKKPLYTKHEDIIFSVISGIQESSSLIGETIKLETRLGNISIRTLNDNCAKHFINAVEDMLFAYRKGWQL